MLPVDGNDEEVHVVAVVLESDHQFTNYISVRVVGGIIKAYGVDDTEHIEIFAFYIVRAWYGTYIPNWLFLVSIEEGLRELS